MKKVIVVGNGMVGYKFCEKLKKYDQDDRFQVVVYGEEPRPAYDRVHLSSFFTEQSADNLLLAKEPWYQEHHIQLHTGELVTAIDTENKLIETHKGVKDHYDYLILATGSSAFVPPIDGVEKHGVFVYRTIENLIDILNYGKHIHKAGVLGGGLLGLEAAKALVDMGLETHVIEFAPRLMPRQLDEQGSALLKSKLETLGLHIHTSKQSQRIAGNGKLQGITFTDDSTLDIEMLVISAGIRPRDEVAKESALAVHQRGGVLVNDEMATSEKDVFAIGEVAVHDNMIYGLVAPGYEMAEIVAYNLTHPDKKTFHGCDMSTKLKLIGVDVGSFGEALLPDDQCIPVTYQDRKSGIYKRLNLSKDGKTLLGGILVGDAEDYNMLHQTFLNNLPLPENPAALLSNLQVDKGHKGNGLGALPETAQICSCENVTKGELVRSIAEDGCSDLNKIKASTKACTGCGGCTPMVQDLLKTTLESMGQKVKKTLCAHFEYSRQELYDIIKVKGIKTYDELLDECGTGDGCEVCKPAVASLLASAWNDLILKEDTIQDTNDRFLANIQRGGTYSVIPRIPAGEITPDKLLAIGRIAKKYNLYTKITGGQRIDMFGARVDQLPLIWEELIAEGFESGHAYGKALRTIKSCVGSTWCRYGVQDSVSFAIEVENRYKGLRAPHKIKGAVSGCIRECAEAQSKDFGIIATEQGWNLYVCGNGGARPQHAQLLAANVDKETCIRYIDRFLMYYIKTADPLTRTATWLNKLDGGLEYLKEVVAEDSLGIGEELEKEMQSLIDRYECEWKKAVETPEIRSKFKHFINSDNADPALEFETIRTQIKPVDWNK